MTTKSKRCVVLLGVVVAVAWLVHALFLRGLAGFLVVDETPGDFQYVCILDGYLGPDDDRCYDSAVNLFRQKSPCGVLVVEPRLERLVETGVLPSFETLSRRELQTRGLPQNAVSVVRSDGYDDWATARALQVWLADRPDASVALLCGRLRSAHVRYALDAVLDPAGAARVRLRALPDRRFDETNWWTSRDGIKAFGIGWLRQLHGWCAGGDHRPPPSCSADQYERNVRQALSEAVP
jgi:hypothetical protein